MKKTKQIFPLVLAVVIVAVLAVALWTRSQTSLFYRETATEDSFRASWLYLDEERSYTFQIDARKNCCVEVDTNGGTYWVEVVDTEGDCIYSTVGQKGHRSWIFSSDQDITVKLILYKHSGEFFIFFSDEPIYGDSR